LTIGGDFYGKALMAMGDRPSSMRVASLSSMRIARRWQRAVFLALFVVFEMFATTKDSCT
jgi:hypothetical protein